MPRTPIIHSRTLAAASIGIAIAGFVFSAFASRAKDDRTVVAEVLAAHSCPATSHAMAMAKKSLERADQARAAGDRETAGLLEGLAREWAEMARDVSNAARVEALAEQRQAAAASARGDIRKTQAMIESLAGRRARAEGELQELHAASSAGISAPALSAARFRTVPPKGSH